jgi:hypothetical protein
VVEVGGDAWARVGAGGGARGTAPAVSGGGRAKQRGSGGDRGRRSRQESEGLLYNFRNFQGLLCKERIPIDTKS